MSQTNVAHEPTRDRILRVAAELFARNGFHGTGVAELCESADVGRGALYYQIGSKEELLFDLCRRHVDEALVAVRAAIEGLDDARDQVQAFAVAHLQILAERRAEVIVAERERHVLTGDLALRLAKVHREYREVLAAVLQRGRDQGHFVAGDHIDVMGALGMLSYTYMWLDPVGSTSVESVAHRFGRMLTQGLAVARPGDSRAT